MCGTSNESCAQGHHFFSLHLGALSNLWGRYDPKTEKNANFLLVTMSFLVKETTEIPQLKAPTRTFISPFYTDEL